MSLIGLDLNATRVRAIQGENRGAGARIPLGLPLDGNELELPLALSLEERQPRVGQAGVSLCRRAPHLACLDFLPYLGDDRVWTAGRHRLNASSAFAVICEHLQRCIGSAEGITAALPPYFNVSQASLLATLAGRARLRLLGSLPSPLAIALAAHEHLPWSGVAVVVDLDGHALTLSAVTVRDDVLHMAHRTILPQLARGLWLCRLLDGASLRCVRLSRRDPRESADTEQLLYDRLAELLDSRGREQMAEIVLQTPHWYQHLKFSPDELAALCSPLVRRSLVELQHFMAEIAELGPVGVVLLSYTASRQPGLTAAIEELICTADINIPQDEQSTDFGEDLIEETITAARLHILEEDAIARAAYDLAGRQLKGELPDGHLESAPLPGSAKAVANDRGSARLHFRGQDHLLSDGIFSLGRDPSCQLVFETELYPTVSARHCEIDLSRGVYLLRDRSRYGTLVNDCLVTQPTALHSGDWIRLGPDGPVLRFLGQAGGHSRLMTTA
jgi:hypothetical protein